ncbi:MAG TPA: hypothetical protein VJG32_18785 [Anaerolineae bacterium]|nr:hypothetical protein [Anaerolineae bacterium]
MFLAMFIENMLTDRSGKYKLGRQTVLYALLMSRAEVPLHTKLTPPGLYRRLLPRPALTAKLREALDYRLTVVQAGAGYGKSTALAALGADPRRVVYPQRDGLPARHRRYAARGWLRRLPRD